MEQRLCSPDYMNKYDVDYLFIASAAKNQSLIAWTNKVSKILENFIQVLFLIVVGAS